MMNGTCIRGMMGSTTRGGLENCCVMGKHAYCKFVFVVMLERDVGGWITLRWTF
jgi:hypothetical protein